MESELKKPTKGMVIAELVRRSEKLTSKNGEHYYVLDISVCKTLTENYFKIRGEEEYLTLSKGDKSLFVFASKDKGKNKYAFSLEKGYIYAFWFTKSYNEERKEEFLHVEGWKTLAPNKKYVERTLQLLKKDLDLKEEEEEEEEAETLSTKELLMELRKRIKKEKVKFILNTSNNEELDIDVELKDAESDYSIDLREEKETEK